MFIEGRESKFVEINYPAIRGLRLSRHFRLLYPEYLIRENSLD